MQSLIIIKDNLLKELFGSKIIVRINANDDNEAYNILQMHCTKRRSGKKKVHDKNKLVFKRVL